MIWQNHHQFFGVKFITLTHSCELKNLTQLKFCMWYYFQPRPTPGNSTTFMCCCSIELVLKFVAITNLYYLPPRGELRCLLVEELTLLSPCGYLGCLLVDILVASLWRTAVYLWRTSPCDRFLTLQSGFFCFSQWGLVATFSSSSGFLPLDQSFLLVPTLRSDFVSNITIGLHWFIKTCCDLSYSLCFALLWPS